MDTYLRKIVKNFGELSVQYVFYVILQAPAKCVEQSLKNAMTAGGVVSSAYALV